MTGRFRVVEQIGDETFTVTGHEYGCFGEALVAAVGLHVGSDQEREFFVDGPGLDRPQAANEHTN